MSDTRRKGHPKPDMQFLEEMYEKGIEKFKPPESLKHCQKDHKSWFWFSDKRHQFSKYGKNSRYNLLRKNEELKLREELNGLVEL